MSSRPYAAARRTLSLTEKLREVKKKCSLDLILIGSGLGANRLQHP